MTTIPEIVKAFDQSLRSSAMRTAPYRHWLLKDALPADTANTIRSLPVKPARIGETEGKRETNNALRVFFSEANQSRYLVCDSLARAFQSPTVTDAIERACGIKLNGSYLRIEYCQDTGDFWLEPHTDIAEKLFTMLIYLSSEPGSEGWGTDIYDADMNHLGSAPCGFNRGLIFIPGKDTWHGFRRRPIEGVRRSIIVNYVKDSWRSRHELCFPNRAVGQSRASVTTGSKEAVS